MQIGKEKSLSTRDDDFLSQRKIARNIDKLTYFRLYLGRGPLAQCEKNHCLEIKMIVKMMWQKLWHF